MFIGGSPMKEATKRSVGRSFSSSGVPSWRSTPASMTAMRSQRASASVWSWVTMMVVSFLWMIQSLIRARRMARRRGSSWPIGSSRRKRSASRMSARARLARCCWPAEIVGG